MLSPNHLGLTETFNNLLMLVWLKFVHLDPRRTWLPLKFHVATDQLLYHLVCKSWLQKHQKRCQNCEWFLMFTIWFDSFKTFSCKNISPFFVWSKKGSIKVKRQEYLSWQEELKFVFWSQCWSLISKISHEVLTFSIISCNSQMFFYVLLLLNFRFQFTKLFRN